MSNDLDSRFEHYTNLMLSRYLDANDGYFYNEMSDEPTSDDRYYCRSWIDGLAWGSLYLGSCFLNPTPDNMRVARRLSVFISNLSSVNGCRGRLSRTYRKDSGEVSGSWKRSPSQPQYQYRDGQAKAGPVAFAFAARAAVHAKSADVSCTVRTDVLQLYATFVKRFYEDKYRILLADGALSDHGDMSPYGVNGMALNAFLTYTILSVGSEVLYELGEDVDASALKQEALKIWRTTWASRISLITRIWVTLMTVWDDTLRFVGPVFNSLLKLVGVKYRMPTHRQKYSNDNLIFMSFLPWIFDVGFEPLSGFRRAEVSKACRTAHGYSASWHSGFFDSVYSAFSNVPMPQISKQLGTFPQEKRRRSSYRTVTRDRTVPMDEAKPAVFMWKRNPYEEYIPDESTPLDRLSYAHVDWLLVYNLGKFLKVI